MKNINEDIHEKLSSFRNTLRLQLDSHLSSKICLTHHLHIRSLIKPYLNTLFYIALEDNMMNKLYEKY
jgi:hypothetical protein